MTSLIAINKNFVKFNAENITFLLQAELPLLNNSGGNQLQAPSIGYQCSPPPLPPNPSLVVTSESDHQISEKRKIEKFESEDKMEKIDIIGRITGEFGRWQLRTVLLIYLTKIPSSWFMACTLIVGCRTILRFILMFSNCLVRFRYNFHCSSSTACRIFLQTKYKCV